MVLCLLNSPIGIFVLAAKGKDMLRILRNAAFETEIGSGLFSLLLGLGGDLKIIASKTVHGPF